MGKNQRKILQMLAEGKISIDEAQRLLELVGSADGEEKGSTDVNMSVKSLPRFLHVIVEPRPDAPDNSECHKFHGHSKVNIRVPLSLIRAGIKFATLMPSETADQVDKAFKDRGFSFNVKKLKEEDLQELITALHDSEINVDNDRELIRIYSE